MTPSIVTLTLNPALDISSTAAVIAPTHKLRCTSPVEEPGGGGLNVARVCRRLGEDTLAVVPLGGSLGRRIDELLTEEGLPHISVPIAGQSRQSMTVTQTNNGDQFRFVFPGPSLSPAEVTRCRDAVIEATRGAKCLVISGSMPGGVDGQIFGELVGALPDVKVILDTSGPALKTAMNSGAYLVKPSAKELASVVDRDLETEADVRDAALQVVRTAELQAIAVSIGPGGVIVASADGNVMRLRAPTVKVKSAVGAGDSMVAGIAVGIARGLSLEESITLGIASGTAAVLSPGTQLCDPGDVERLLPLVARA